MIPEKGLSCDASEVLDFIKSKLKDSTLSIGLDELLVSTDLIEAGVESIKLLMLLVEIEQEFGVCITLESLEASGNQFSVNSILSTSQS